MPFWVDIRYINQAYMIRMRFQELVLSINQFHEGFCNKKTRPHFEAIANCVELILDKCLNIPKVFNGHLFDKASENVISNFVIIKTLGSNENGFTLTETIPDKFNQFNKQVNNAYLYYMQLSNRAEKKSNNDSPVNANDDEIETDHQLLSHDKLIKVINQWRYIPLKNLNCTDKITHLFCHYTKPMVFYTAALYYLSETGLLDAGIKLLEDEAQRSLSNPTSWIPPLILGGIGAGFLIWQKHDENPRLPKQKDEKLIQGDDVEAPSISLTNDGDGGKEAYKRLSPRSASPVSSPVPRSSLAS